MKETEIYVSGLEFSMILQNEADLCWQAVIQCIPLEVLL